MSSIGPLRKANATSAFASLATPDRFLGVMVDVFIRQYCRAEARIPRFASRTGGDYGRSDEVFPIGSFTLRQASPDPRTALEDCRKLCRCRVRLRALYLALGLKPIVQILTVSPSALLVKFVGALLNLLLNWDQKGRLVRLRCEC